MDRRNFIQYIGGAPFVIGSGLSLSSCKTTNAPRYLKSDSELIEVPSFFSIWQFYAPYSSSNLRKLGMSPEIWHNKHVRIDYDTHKRLLPRVFSTKKDGANHPSTVDVQKLLSSPKGEFKVPKSFLNHSNPKSHLIYVNKGDINELLEGKTVYLATGFHKQDHFHIVMIKPSFAKGGTFYVTKSELAPLSSNASVGSSPQSPPATAPETTPENSDLDGDGVNNSEDKCPGSEAAKSVWNKDNFIKGSDKYKTAEKFNGCGAGQSPE
jgi:hypothetical protein